jgi:hypothetical protein
MRRYSKNLVKAKKTGGVVQVVDCLPRKCKALIQTPVPPKPKHSSKNKTMQKAMFLEGQS